jgi:DNA-binding transcriptional LysR family regulator
MCHSDLRFKCKAEAIKIKVTNNIIISKLFYMKIEELNLTSLKYFLDTVETGSLTQASIMNFVTRPAISQAIIRLEKWLGFLLLKHGKKTFELTAEGQKFYRTAKYSFESFQLAMKSELSDPAELKVGCSISLAEHFLIPGLKQLPSIANLELKAGTAKQLIRNLEDNEINLALLIDEVRVSGLQTEILHSGFYSLASRNGTLQGPLITTEDRQEVRTLHKHLQKDFSKPIETIKAESWSLCLKLALHLNGTCLLPDFLIDNQLKPVRLRGFKASFRVLLVHPRTALLSETEVRLIQSIKKSAQR